MSKWASRTYWLIVGVISVVTLLLVNEYVTDVIWQGVVMGMVLGWIGNDLTNKIKGKNEQ